MTAPVGCIVSRRSCENALLLNQVFGRSVCRVLHTRVRCILRTTAAMTGHMKLTPVTTADLPDVGAACQLGPDGRPLYASLWLTPNPWGECVQATTRVLVKLPKL